MLIKRIEIPQNPQHLVYCKYLFRLAIIKIFKISKFLKIIYLKCQNSRKLERKAKFKEPPNTARYPNIG